MSEQVSPRPVLFVIDHFRNPNAGTEGQMFKLISGLDKEKFKPILLVFRESRYLQENEFPCEYHVLGRTRMFSPFTVVALWKMARKFRASGVSLAHVFFNDPSVICPPIFRMNGIKTVISRRDMGYWYTPAYRALLAISGRFAISAIANSDAVRKLTVEAEPFNQSAVHVIYNGYNEVQADLEIPTDLVNLRKKYPGAVFAGLVANIRAIKRIEDAVMALSMVQRTGNDLHLLLIGDGNQEELRRLAVEKGVAGKVHFIGPRKDVEACLKALDVGLLCSESEGFSNAIVEYMQAGLPVVCSRVGGNPEAVQHGVTGYLYPCGDIGELASYLEALANDSELRHQIGDNALKHARERFGMEVMVTKHQEIYEGLIGSGSDR